MNGTIEAAVVRGFACFEQLTAEEAGDAALRLEQVHLEPGDVLFREGDQGDAAYLIVGGEMEITIGVPGQEDRLLSVLGPSAIFGEMALLLNEPRTATAVARSQAALLRIPVSVYKAALEREDPWALKFLLATARGLARRLSALDHQLVGLIVDLRESESRVPGPRVAELEGLRQRLFSHWSF